MEVDRDSCKRVFRKTERELVRLSSEQSVEAVHGFRTATRRLAILLESVVSTQDRNQRKLLKILDRIRRRAGRVRDIDAQLVALRSLKISLEPRRKTQLVQRLIELRVKHEKNLRKLLKRHDVRDLRRRLRKAWKNFRPESLEDPLTVAQAILASVASGKGGADDETLHRYRLAVKQARYAAEFAPKSESAQLIPELKRLQDALGAWHDWWTLTQTATQHLGEVNQSPLVAALHNVTRGKFRHAASAIANAHVLMAALSPNGGVPPDTGWKRPAAATRAQTAA